MESHHSCFPYVHLDGIILKRSWGGEVKNISVLVALGIGAEAIGRSLESPKARRRISRAGAAS